MPVWDFSDPLIIEAPAKGSPTLVLRLPSSPLTTAAAAPFKIIDAAGNDIAYITAAGVLNIDNSLEIGNDLSVEGDIELDGTLQWESDGDGAIGSSTTARPASIYATTQLVIGSTAASRAAVVSTSGRGYIRLGTAPTDVPVPGTDTTALYFVAGTDPDTVKLVARSGAGAATTIFDNIPIA
jgi:hypothetical protein